jgi:CheY-like chemotaxis protein
MLDHEDLKWIATTSTELNSILQQVSRYADLAQRQRGEHNYIELLGERVELATRTGQALFDRVTSKILAGATRKSASGRKGTARFTVVPPPVHTNTSPLSVPASRQSVQKGVATRPGSLANGKENEPAPDTSEILTDARVKNPKGNREYILLVEDEPQVAELASEMLADEGYRVVIAGDGFEALKIYERIGKQIGLVILDFFLPVMDGDAVFDELRSINPTVDVVLSSGFAEQSKISSMLGQGLRGFIPKPYSREKLLEQVRSTLDAPRQAH